MVLLCARADTASCHTGYVVSTKQPAGLWVSGGRMCTAVRKGCSELWVLMEAHKCSRTAMWILSLVSELCYGAGSDGALFPSSV